MNHIKQRELSLKMIRKMANTGKHTMTEIGVEVERTFFLSVSSIKNILKNWVEVGHFKMEEDIIVPVKKDDEDYI